jgi:hypothetical protein
VCDLEATLYQVETEAKIGRHRAAPPRSTRAAGNREDRSFRDEWPETDQNGASIRRAVASFEAGLSLNIDAPSAAARQSTTLGITCRCRPVSPVLCAMAPRSRTGCCRPPLSLPCNRRRTVLSLGHGCPNSDSTQAALDAQFVIYNAKRSHQGCAAKGRTRSLQHRVPANDNSQEDTAGRADQPDAI